jgi:hypothetical protein
MNDLLCSDCQHVFSEDEAGRFTEVERLSGRATIRLTMLCCPTCGSDNIGPTTTEEEE